MKFAGSINQVIENYPIFTGNVNRTDCINMINNFKQQLITELEVGVIGIGVLRSRRS